MFLLTLLLPAQSLATDLRLFQWYEFDGAEKATIEILNPDTVRVICFWPTRLALFNGFRPYYQPEKVWEDHETFIAARDFATGDLNGDGQLDFVVAGLGLSDVKTMQHMLGFYLSSGRYEYRKLLISRDKIIEHLIVGDINGDGQQEIIFAESADNKTTLTIGHWSNSTDNFTFAVTQLSVDSETFWKEIKLGDVDRDGNKELLISTFGQNWDIKVHDFEVLRVTPNSPTRTILRQEEHSQIVVDHRGRILELTTKPPRLTAITFAEHGFIQRETLDIGFMDPKYWNPISISTYRNKTIIMHEIIHLYSHGRSINIYDEVETIGREFPMDSEYAEWAEELIRGNIRTMESMVDRLYRLPHKPWPEPARKMTLYIINRYFRERNPITSEIVDSETGEKLEYRDHEGIIEWRLLQMANWQKDPRFVPFFVMNITARPAIQGLMDIGAPSFEPLLYVLRDTRKPHVQREAAKVFEAMLKADLPFLRDNEERRRLKNALIEFSHTEFYEYRITTISALKYINDPAVVALLDSLSQHDEYYRGDPYPVREKAREALRFMRRKFEDK